MALHLRSPGNNNGQNLHSSMRHICEYALTCLKMQIHASIVSVIICQYMDIHLDIHRTGKAADWYAVPEARRNLWQRLASRTHGFVTPGNFVSVIGAALAILGFVWLYQDRLTAGLIAIAVGRSCDILDGSVAQYTGTKSSLGETVDAGLDKVVMLAAFLVFASTDLVPFMLVILLASQQLISAVLSGYARLCHMALHPSPLGKIAMAVQWVVLLGYILAAIVGVSSAVMNILHVAFIGAILAGSIATYGYAQHVWRVSRSRQ